MDNTSIIIEKLALELGSYIEAMTEFKESRLPGTDYEDIVSTLNPVLIQKIRQEFINKNFVPDEKKRGSLLDFLEDDK